MSDASIQNPSDLGLVHYQAGKELSARLIKFAKQLDLALTEIGPLAEAFGNLESSGRLSVALTDATFFKIASDMTSSMSFLDSSSDVLVLSPLVRDDMPAERAYLFACRYESKARGLVSLINKDVDHNLDEADINIASRLPLLGRDIYLELLSKSFKRFSELEGLVSKKIAKMEHLADDEPMERSPIWRFAFNPTVYLPSMVLAVTKLRLIRNYVNTFCVGSTIKAFNSLIDTDVFQCESLEDVLSAFSKPKSNMSMSVEKTQAGVLGKTKQIIEHATSTTGLPKKDTTQYSSSSYSSSRRSYGSLGTTAHSSYSSYSSTSIMYASTEDAKLTYKAEGYPVLQEELERLQRRKEWKKRTSYNY